MSSVFACEKVSLVKAANLRTFNDAVIADIFVTWKSDADMLEWRLVAKCCHNFEFFFYSGVAYQT